MHVQQQVFKNHHSDGSWAARAWITDHECQRYHEKPTSTNVANHSLTVRSRLIAEQSQHLAAKSQQSIVILDNPGPEKPSTSPSIPIINSKQKKIVSNHSAFNTHRGKGAKLPIKDFNLRSATLKRGSGNQTPWDTSDGRGSSVNTF